MTPTDSIPQTIDLNALSAYVHTRVSAGGRVRLEDVEDATQTAHLAALQAKRPILNLKAYMLQAAKNSATNVVRSDAKLRKLPDRVYVPSDFNSDADPQVITHRLEQRERMREALFSMDLIDILYVTASASRFSNKKLTNLFKAFPESKRCEPSYHKRKKALDKMRVLLSDL